MKKLDLDHIYWNTLHASSDQEKKKGNKEKFTTCQLVFNNLHKSNCNNYNKLGCTWLLVGSSNADMITVRL